MSLKVYVCAGTAETVSHSAAQTVLELCIPVAPDGFGPMTILLPQVPRCRSYRYEPLGLTYFSSLRCDAQ